VDFGEAGDMAGATLPDISSDGLRRWRVAAAIIERDGEVLLVQNLRRNGASDWSTPGGVVEAGEADLDGLTREVREETGLSVDGWSDRVYTVQTRAADMGWHLEAVIYRALAWDGEIAIDDPDGIVTDARFTPLRHCGPRLDGTPRWVHEPLLEYLRSPWTEHRQYTYELIGAHRDSARVERT
jgi:8-oxo-dGTP diphosphatase